MPKRVHSAFTLFEASLAKQLLEREGILCFLRNEVLGRIPGPKDDYSPEVWVQDDADAARATEILRAWQSGEVSGEPWTCPECREQIEAQFDACWNCETPRPDAAHH
jgi:hypothetical protein